MNLTWIGRNRSLELSPRARLVDDVQSLDATDHEDRAA